MSVCLYVRELRTCAGHAMGSLGDTPERLLAATNYIFRNHGIPEIPNVALKKERTNGRK